MARDYEDLHDRDDLSDDELRDLVREQLADNNALDIDELTVEVNDGRIRLCGRVGTDTERLIAEHVVTDLIGADRVDNQIFVDPMRRALSPEAIDEHLVEEEERSPGQLGDRPVPLSPETETVHPDLDAELYGTRDVGRAIQDGTSWVPPESPTQEGFTRRDEYGEDH